MTEVRSNRERRANRAYTRRLVLVLLAYGALLALAIVVLNTGVVQPWRTLAALAPMAPLVFLPIAVARLLGDLDELQGRILLQALAIGFAGGSLLTFSYGFLQLVGAPALSWFWVWPVYATCWIIGTIVARRGYGGGE